LTFQECCSECIGNHEFVHEFNRLSGLHLGEPRTGIQMAIDNACGYDPDKAAMPEFVEFVYEYIWIPLITQKQD
jgi:hypothetical protein